MIPRPAPGVRRNTHGSLDFRTSPAPANFLGQLAGLMKRGRWAPVGLGGDWENGPGARPPSRLSTPPSQSLPEPLVSFSIFDLESAVSPEILKEIRAPARASSW